MESIPRAKDRESSRLSMSLLQLVYYNKWKENYIDEIP